MDINENSMDLDWPSTLVKKEIENNDDKKPVVRPKENRNFCERWLSLFSPWLTRCEDDSNRPFCRACQRPLDNNRFRLQRHERTAKHSRNQEILLNEGEDVVRLILSRCKQRKRFVKKEAPEKPFSFNVESTCLDTEKPFGKHKISKTKSAPIEKNVLGSFKSEEELHSTADFSYSPHQYSRSLKAPPLPKKDSFDMFFEAISASVKLLPPKLAAEVKSRITQVITEFELRAICEREAQEKSQQSVISLPAQITNVVTAAKSRNINNNEENSSAVNSAPTVTQYIYSYQPKRDT